MPVDAQALLAAVHHVAEHKPELLADTALGLARLHGSIELCVYDPHAAPAFKKALDDAVAERFPKIIA